MEPYRPLTSDSFTCADAQRYLSNFLLELEHIPFTADERRLLLQKKILGKLVDERTRQFFLYHFGALLGRAVRALFDGATTPRILELGCGSGSGALLFSLLGARVVGLDINPVLISACRRRQRFYETHFGPLDVRFETTDVLRFDYRTLAPLDGVYSLFAFNLIQPSTELLARLIPALAPNGKIVISDGNQDGLFNSWFRHRAVLTPAQVGAILAAKHCRVREEFHCIVPPLLTRIRAGLDFGVRLERVLNRIGLVRWLGVSYTLVAERGEHCGGGVR